MNPASHGHVIWIKRHQRREIYGCRNHHSTESCMKAGPLRVPRGCLLHEDIPKAMAAFLSSMTGSSHL